MKKISKQASLLIVALVYVAAFLGGWLFYYLVNLWTNSPLLAFFAADVAATITVWLFGIAFKNASMYDPYWSVAPIVMIIFFVFTAPVSHIGISISDALFIVVFMFWGVRLTLNWIILWPGMKHQDWRYTMLHDQNVKMWPLTNFFGINMIPTLFVFAGMVPAFFAVTAGGGANALLYIGFVVCILAPLLQIVSDGQMYRFRQDPTNAGKHMQIGLWKYSRHPNYLGEVSFWWGIWIMQLGVLPAMWWTVAAPVAMTLLFVLISIPMMEKRLKANKQGYEEYAARTPMLLPYPKKVR